MPKSNENKTIINDFHYHLFSFLLPVLLNVNIAVPFIEGMKIFNLLYSIWFLTVFSIGYLFILPIQFLALQSKKTYAFAHYMNKVWAWIFFIGGFIPLKKEIRGKKPYPRPAVYCANHTSYIDIPLIFFALSGYFKIIGKKSLDDVPVFGYMFSRLYISVNRKGAKSILESIQKSIETINNNQDIVFYPEGTIPPISQHPHLSRFKDGPFKVAIETQVPIVPITIPYNWKFVGDVKFPINWHPLKIIVHEPIETVGMTLDDINDLKSRTYNIIEKELKRHNPELSENNL